MRQQRQRRRARRVSAAGRIAWGCQRCACVTRASQPCFGMVRGGMGMIEYGTHARGDIYYTGALCANSNSNNCIQCCIDIDRTRLYYCPSGDDARASILSRRVRHPRAGPLKDDGYVAGGSARGDIVLRAFELNCAPALLTGPNCSA